jgi:ABC-2 type transport system permease protein
MKQKITDLRKRYRYSVILLKQLVKTDFKLRYQGSFLGYLWSLLRPLLMFAILYVVLTDFLPLGKGIQHYPVYLFVGIVLWNYFLEVTTGSVNAIVSRGDLLRKINFPRYVIILAGSFSALMIVGHVPLTAHAVVLIPLVVELFVLSIALAFFLSALFVKFRDISYIWDVIIQGAFYATPILYALNRVPAKYTKVIMLNPMAQIIQDARHGLVTSTASNIHSVWGGDNWIWVIPIGLTVVISLIAASYFRHQAPHFAEEV